MTTDKLQAALLRALVATADKATERMEPVDVASTYMNAAINVALRFGRDPAEIAGLLRTVADEVVAELDAEQRPRVQ